MELRVDGPSHTITQANPLAPTTCPPPPLKHAAVHLIAQRKQAPFCPSLGHPIDPPNIKSLDPPLIIR